MKRISVDLMDEQGEMLDQMVQETALTADIMVTSAINEFYRNFTAWKTRLELRKREG